MRNLVECQSRAGKIALTVFLLNLSVDQNNLPAFAEPAYWPSGKATRRRSLLGSRQTAWCSSALRPTRFLLGMRKDRPVVSAYHLVLVEAKTSRPWPSTRSGWPFAKIRSYRRPAGSTKPPPMAVVSGQPDQFIRLMGLGLRGRLLCRLRQELSGGRFDTTGRLKP